MISSLLTSLLTLPITPTILLAMSLFVVICYALYLDHKIVVLTKGSSGASLEDIIRSCISNAETIEKQNTLLAKHAEILEEKVSHSLRNAQTIRYKAFDASGSNQSFSVALINEKGNGLVLSSLHTHDRMSTFAKPLENYESTYELTEEELAVINDSRAAHQNRL